MRTEIKQAMHMEAVKSFGTAEANENECRWNEERFDQKNQDPTNHYDITRQHLNFEIDPDGKIHTLGYQEKSLEVRLAERLEQLGWHSFKEGSKNQPNCVPSSSSVETMIVHSKWHSERSSTCI